MKWLLKWVLGAAALYLTVFSWQFVVPIVPMLGKPTALSISGAVGALFSIAIITLVNTFIRPVVRLLALPLSCLTFGLIGLVINALMFWLAGALNFGLTVNGFLPALYGSIVLSMISGMLNVFLVDKKEKERD
jgi:putative membrane protein